MAKQALERICKGVTQCRVAQGVMRETRKRSVSVLSRAMSGVESIRSPAGGGANNTGQNMAPSREGAFQSYLILSQLWFWEIEYD